MHPQTLTRRSLLVTLITFSLLATNPSPDATRQAEQLSLWATFLGVTSTLLAAFQYLPQIIHTYRHKLVGALSIGMMLIQTPGAVLMVLSIALRWVPYKPASHAVLIDMQIIDLGLTGRVSDFFAKYMLSSNNIQLGLRMLPRVYSRVFC